MLDNINLTADEVIHMNKKQIDKERKIIENAIGLLKESKNDPIATGHAVGKIAETLAQFETSKQEILANFIADESGIGKQIIKKELKKVIAKSLSEKKVNGEFNESIPVIVQVKMFIKKYYKIRYNDISNRFEQLNNQDTDVEKWEEVNEDEIYCHLQEHSIKYSKPDLISVLKSSFIGHYNPIKEYFTKEIEEWDGTDHIKILARYINVEQEDKERFVRMFKKMLIRSVACSLEHTFNKHAFILVHEKQNSGKSTFLRWLCPPDLQEYYTENINTDKDSLIALAENFIINLDELSTLSKFEINALKSVMSKDRIKVRLPYDRRASNIKRRCNFVGSTNRMEFLSDESGSVRWICFDIKSIDWDYINDVQIDKVWAQAYYLFTHARDKYAYQLTVDEIEENERANSKFIIRTNEMDLIQRFYLPGTPDDHEQFMTSTDMMESLQKKTSTQWKLSKVQVGKALAMLGFKREQKYNAEAGFMIKGYYIKNNMNDYTENKHTLHDEENENDGLPY